jgi:hypothetical protein
MLWVLFLEVALEALHHQYILCALPNGSAPVEDSDEIKNINPTRRIKLGESKPVTWTTNAGIIRNLSKKGTTDGGKGGFCSPLQQMLWVLFLEVALEALHHQYILCALPNGSALSHIHSLIKFLSDQ